MEQKKINLELTIPQCEQVVSGLGLLGQQFQMLSVDIGNQAAPQFAVIMGLQDKAE